MAPRSTPMDRFNQQRWRANNRGIAWLLSFDEWWQIWQQSGNWHLRGLGCGRYVMSRHGDVGPYAAGNVSIKLFTDNIREIYAGTARKGGRGNVGKGKGWSYRAGRRLPYVAYLQGKRIGNFATSEEASEARNVALRSLIDTPVTPTPTEKAVTNV